MHHNNAKNDEKTGGWKKKLCGKILQGKKKTGEKTDTGVNGWKWEHVTKEQLWEQIYNNKITRNKECQRIFFLLRFKS